jgi:hypothetical protein
MVWQGEVSVRSREVDARPEDPPHVLSVVASRERSPMATLSAGRGPLVVGAVFLDRQLTVPRVNSFF